MIVKGVLCFKSVDMFNIEKACVRVNFDVKSIVIFNINKSYVRVVFDIN